LNIEIAKISRTPAETLKNVGTAFPTGLTSLPLMGKVIPSKKSKKTIEIVTVPKLSDITTHQKNVGINLDAEVILEILSSCYQNVTITEIITINDLEKLVTRKPDLVLSGVKYFDFDGKDLWLNDYLDRYDIAYMASCRKALDCESDKSRAKDIMQKAGIATAQYLTTAPGEHLTEDSIPLKFPLFIKPITGGDSRGVDANSVVKDFTSFVAKVTEIHNTQQSRSLVETYLSGKEYSVGIFEDSFNGHLTAMPVEIIAEENVNGDRILDFKIKSDDSERVIAVTDMNIHRQLSDLAKAAFKALGGKSLGRIDIKMNHDLVPHFIEANLMPGLRKGYFYRACSLNLNMSYEQMILKIADNGLSHS
jgi:D-alanine-D-alanine ligase